MEMVKWIPKRFHCLLKNSKMIQVTSYTEIDSLQTQIIKCPLQEKAWEFFQIIFFILGLKVKDPTNGFIFVSKKYLSDFYIFGNFNAAQQILLDSKIRKLKFEQIDINLKQEMQETRLSG